MVWYSNLINNVSFVFSFLGLVALIFLLEVSKGILIGILSLPSVEIVSAE